MVFNPSGRRNFLLGAPAMDVNNMRIGYMMNFPPRSLNPANTNRSLPKRKNSLPALSQRVRTPRDAQISKHPKPHRLGSLHGVGSAWTETSRQRQFE